VWRAPSRNPSSLHIGPDNFNAARKDAKTNVLSEERAKRREHIIELGFEAYDELGNIAS